MIRAVLFDFDGTIADTIPALQEGINLTMQQLGYPTHTCEEVRSFVNHGPRKLITRALPKELQGDEALIDRVFEVYEQNYRKVYLHTNRSYDGVDVLIRELHKTYRIGVLSNKQDYLLEALCRATLFPDTFDATQGFLPGVFAKPDLAMTKKLTDRLGVLPEECVLIGDSEVDIATAANAGMTYIGAGWGFTPPAVLRRLGAKSIAMNAGEIPSILQDVLQKQINKGKRITI